MTKRRARDPKSLDRARPRRNTTMRRLNRTTAGILTAGLLLTLASCGGDDPNTGTDPTPSEPTTSTSETTDPTPSEPTPTKPATDEDKAAAALLGYLEVRDQAYATGRISKKLNKYATGQEHFGLQQFVTTLNNQAKARFEGDWGHEVIRAKEETTGEVLVTDCQDSSNVSIVRRSDGETLPWIKFEDEEIPRRLEQTYRVVLDDDLWKVQLKTSLVTKVRLC